jgi:polysaccharide export outer membrane protein
MARFGHSRVAPALGCILVLAAQAGCAPGKEMPPLPAYTSNGYLLGDQLTGEFTVDDQGKIAVPLLGVVQAAGSTPEQLSKKIAGDLNKTGVMRDASVVVQVLSYRPIFVLGEVAKPGQYPYQPGMTMLTAAAVAGGFTYRAVQDYADDIRSQKGEAVEGTITPDSFLAPGDVVKIYQRRF